jgi:surfactin synthase thioesterase subunit
MHTARLNSPGGWLRSCGVPARRPLVRLVCLPHAGGTAHAYRSWPALLPADVAVFAVQYPGRQDRFAEPLVDDIGQMTQCIAAAVQPFLGEPLVIFGHSMGAFVAYEVTVELERRHGPVVDLLMVSGAPPPHRKALGQLHTRSDAALIADIKRINASFLEVAAKPDLLGVLLPMIRADYRLSETYTRGEPVPVSAALVAVGGAADPEVSRDRLEAWSACAAGPFEAITLPGTHFYLFEDETTVARSLAARLPARGQRPAGRAPAGRPPGPGVPAGGQQAPGPHLGSRPDPRDRGVPQMEADLGRWDP